MYIKEKISEEVITDQNAERYSILDHGSEIYMKQCIVCHGKSGDKELSGAKKLILSTKGEKEIKQLILKGNKTMPSYEKVLSNQDIEAVIAFIQEEFMNKSKKN